MFKFKNQLDNLEKHLKTQGDFEVKIHEDNLFYEIRHPNFINTYVNTFKENDDLSNPPVMLDKFIDSTKEKLKSFEEYFKYFNESDKYNIQFLNSYTDQLDILITHIDTNRKYFLYQIYDIVEQKYPMFNLYREITISPIDGKSKWVNLTSPPAMHIELTKFNKQPKPHELDNTILQELKIDTQNYVSYK